MQHTYSIQSFDTKGHRIQRVNESPAFYALVVDGLILDYFTSIQAAKYAVEQIELAQADEVTEVNHKQAA